MAKSNGVLPVSGTIDNLTFSETKNGTLVRKKTKYDPNRIATDPVYAKLRQQMSEFGHVTAATTGFSDAFQEAVNQFGDRKVFTRLRTAIKKVVQADTTNRRGQRNVLSGAPEKLNGFRFNSNFRLGKVLPGNYYTPSIDRATGTMRVDVKAMTPTRAFGKRPPKATHFSLMIAGAAVGFNNESVETAYASSEILELSAVPLEAFTISVNVPANSTYPLFLALGINFYESDTGALVEVIARSYIAMEIIAVSPRP